MSGLVAGTIFFTVSLGPVFTLFLLKIGVREKIIGFLSILPSVVGIFSLWMIRIVAKNPVANFINAAWKLFVIECCFLPVFILAGILPSSMIIAIFSLLLFVFYFPSQQYVYAWFPVIESVIPSYERGRFLGTLRIILTFAGYSVLFVCSKILGPNPDYLRFFFAHLTIMMISICFPVFLSRSGIPEIKKEAPEKIGFLDEFIKILNNKDHAAYFRFLAMWTFITGITGPFLMPFYKTELGLSTSFCVTLASVNTLGYGLSVFGWGRVVDRHGSRYVLFVSCCFAILYLLLLSHIHLFPEPLMKKLLLFISFFGGVVFAGQLMGDTTRRMALCPEQNKSSYFAYMLVFGAQLPLIVASPLSGFILERYRNFQSGLYGIYQTIMILTMFLHLLLLYQIFQMRPLKEKPIVEILKYDITESLMKLRDVIASPP
ncbi:MAG TPA: MFS transporter [bacterium]|nr:MFS transporter [bacterium]HOL34962.1 MFS transporter [bacterium]HPP07734.1 MFS transporter [bacterium]